MRSLLALKLKFDTPRIQNSSCSLAMCRLRHDLNASKHQFAHLALLFAAATLDEACNGLLSSSRHSGGSVRTQVETNR